MNDSLDVDELKSYVQGVLGGYVIAENMGYCKKCGKWEDLRFGYCFDCCVPKCPLKPEDCEFKKLVFNYKRERVWRNMQMEICGKIYCDRDKGLCAKAKNYLKLKGEKLGR